MEQKQKKKKSLRKWIVGGTLVATLGGVAFFSIKNYFDIKVGFTKSNNKEIKQQNESGDNVITTDSGTTIIAKDSGKIDINNGTTQRNEFNAPVQQKNYYGPVDQSRNVDSSKNYYDQRKYETNNYEGDPPPQISSLQTIELNKEMKEGSFVIKNGVIFADDPTSIKNAYRTTALLKLTATKQPNYIGCQVINMPNIISMEIRQAHRGELFISTQSVFDPQTMGILNPKVGEYEIELYTYEKIKNIEKEVRVLLLRP